MIVAFHGCAKSVLKDPHEFTTIEQCKHCGTSHAYRYNDNRRLPEPKKCIECGEIVYLCSVCTEAITNNCNDKRYNRCKALKNNFKKNLKNM